MPLSWAPARIWEPLPLWLIPGVELGDVEVAVQVAEGRGGRSGIDIGRWQLPPAAVVAYERGHRRC